MIDPALFKWVSSRKGDTPSVVFEASDRKQVNVPKGLMEVLEGVGGTRGQKLTTVVIDAALLFLAVSSRKWDDAYLKSDAYHDLEQLAVRFHVDVFRLIACAAEALALTSRSNFDEDTLVFERLLATCPSGQPLSEHIAKLLELGLSAQRTDSEKD